MSLFILNFSSKSSCLFLINLFAISKEELLFLELLLNVLEEWILNLGASKSFLFPLSFTVGLAMVFNGCKENFEAIFINLLFSSSFSLIIKFKVFVWLKLFDSLFSFSSSYISSLGNTLISYSNLFVVFFPSLMPLLSLLSFFIIVLFLKRVLTLSIRGFDKLKSAFVCKLSTSYSYSNLSFVDGKFLLFLLLNLIPLPIELTVLCRDWEESRFPISSSFSWLVSSILIISNVSIIGHLVFVLKILTSSKGIWHII